MIEEKKYNDNLTNFLFDGIASLQYQTMEFNSLSNKIYNDFISKYYTNLKSSVSVNYIYDFIKKNSTNSSNIQELMIKFRANLHQKATNKLVPIMLGTGLLVLYFWKRK